MLKTFDKCTQTTDWNYELVSLLHLIWLLYKVCQYLGPGIRSRLVTPLLRSTMGQDRLNDLMLLHVHKDITDNLNVKEVINCYVKDSEHRLRFFGKFHKL